MNDKENALRKPQGVFFVFPTASAIKFCPGLHLTVASA